MRLEVAAHDLENVDQHGIPERIENLITFFSIRDKLPAAQDRQVLRKIGLLDGKSFLDGTCGKLAFFEDFDDCDSGGMC